MIQNEEVGISKPQRSYLLFVKLLQEDHKAKLDKKKDVSKVLRYVKTIKHVDIIKNQANQVIQFLKHILDHEAPKK